MSEAQVSSCDASSRASSRGASSRGASHRVGRPASATLEEFSPQLADQLVDQSLRTLSRGSSRTVEWRCEHGHVWPNPVCNRTGPRKATCTVCSGKRVLAGFNDVATTRPDVARLMADQSLTTRLTANSGRTVRFQCPHDSRHWWMAPVSRVTRGSGCPYCSGRYASPGVNDLQTVRPDLAAQLVDRSLAVTLQIKSNTSVQWRCAKGHVWNMPVSDRSRGYGCPVCSGRRRDVGVNDLATTHPDYAATLVDPQLATTLGPQSARMVAWRCVGHPDHIWFTAPGNRLKASVDGGCPICSGRVVMPGFNDIATTNPALAAQLADQSQATAITGHSDKPVEWVCPHDGHHHWMASPCARDVGRLDYCPVCSTCWHSEGESQLAAVVAALVGPDAMHCSDRHIIDRDHELDMVVPSLSLALEYDGVYWHSEAAGKEPGYHGEKSRLAEQVGYQLIHVFEDDWLERRDIVIRAIAHRLGATGHLPDVIPDMDPLACSRIAARQCMVRRVDGSDAGVFLDANHIQGRLAASRHYALLDADDHIRALMSLRAPQHNARAHRADGVWDVARYATCGIVPGGFTRLLDHAAADIAADKLSITQWVSFSARSISDGGLYRTAGFTADREYQPDYWYVGDATKWRRASKESFQKKRFHDDPSLMWQDGRTEHELALMNRLYRIYDAGKTRWVKQVESPTLSHCAMAEHVAAGPAPANGTLHLPPAPAVASTTAPTSTAAPTATSPTAVAASSSGPGDAANPSTPAGTRDNAGNPAHGTGDGAHAVVPLHHPRRTYRTRQSYHRRRVTPDDTLRARYPDLAAQLVDSSLADTLTPGSNTSVQWRCPKCHGIWPAQVKGRTSGLGCPYCAGRATLPGFNDLATVRPDLAAQLVDQSLAHILTAGSNHTVDWCCPTCHGVWPAMPNTRTRRNGTGCPYCAGTKSLPGFNDLAHTHPSLARELADPSTASSILSGSSTKVLWHCGTCGQDWPASPASRTRSHSGCPYCSGRIPIPGVNDLGTLMPELASQLVDPSLATTLTIGSGRKPQWRDPDHPDHVWTATVKDRVRAFRAGRIGDTALKSDGTRMERHPGMHATLGQCRPDLLAEAVDPGTATGLTEGSGKVISWRCPKCQLAYQRSVRDRATRNLGCPNCDTQQRHVHKD